MRGWYLISDVYHETDGVVLMYVTLLPIAGIQKSGSEGVNMVS